MGERLVLTEPEQIAPYVVEHFDAAAENEIVQAEHQVMGARPFSPELGLLYALRVSKCVPTLKSFKTLGSRWNVASGVSSGGLMGLICGLPSPNHDLVKDFLTRLYLRRFCDLAKEIALKAEAAAIRAATEEKRSDAFYKAISKIQEGMIEVPLDGTSTVYQRWCRYLEQRAKGLAVDYPEL